MPLKFVENYEKFKLHTDTPSIYTTQTRYNIRLDDATSLNARVVSSNPEGPRHALPSPVPAPPPPPNTPLACTTTNGRPITPRTTKKNQKGQRVNSSPPGTDVMFHSRAYIHTVCIKSLTFSRKN